MPLIQDLLNEIDNAVIDFEKVIPGIEREAANEIARLFAQLDTRAGFLKPTVKNLRAVQKLKSSIYKAIVNKNYTTSVEGLLKSYSTVSGIQDQYFATIATTFEKGAVLKEVERLARINTIESLTGAGIESQLVQQVLDKALNNVKSASSFVDLRDEMDFFLKGNAEFPGKLQAYSGQIVTDSINQFARSYNEIVAADLGLKWFQYVGTTVTDSRKWCVEMVKKKWIHESELPKLIKGTVNGVTIPKYAKTGLPEGMIAGTNSKNVTIRLGGWRCKHQMIAVATLSVPQSVRDKLGKANVSQMTNFERSINKNNYETGAFFHKGENIFEKKGTGRAVSFNSNELSDVFKNVDRQDIVLTHNHPAKIKGIGGSFSQADVNFISKLNIGEIRAVDEVFEYSLKRTGDKLTRAQLTQVKSTFTREMNKMYKGIRGRDRDHSLELFYGDGSHSVMEILAKKLKDLGFVYSRTPLSDG